jgi:hypothetical protein
MSIHRREISNWSYGNDPLKNDVDAVRFSIGDTYPDDKQISDCEIKFLLSKEGNVLEASICAVQSLIALYARDFDNKSKSMSAQVTANYRLMLASLKEKRSNNLSPIYAGGLTISDKKTNEENSDVVQPMFTRELDDNRRDGRQYQ